MKCSKCGADNLNTAKYCSNCGNLLLQACPKCGNQINEEDLFCTNCGFQLRDTAATNNELKRSPSTIVLPSSTRIVIGIVSLLAAFILLIIGINNSDWEQDELIFYELGAIFLSIVGIWFFKRNYFLEKKSLGIIMIGYGSFILLIGIICEKVNSNRYWHDPFSFSNVILQLLVFLVLAITGAIFCKKSTDNKHDSNDKSDDEYYGDENTPESPILLNSAKSEEANHQEEIISDKLIENQPTITNDNTKEKTTYSSDFLPEKVHFNTKIDGRYYGLAAYISYIGLPIGTILLLFRIVNSFNNSEPILCLLNFLDLVLLCFAWNGLAVFKRKSFIALVVRYWITLLSNCYLYLDAIINNADTSLTLSYLSPIAICTFCLIYFYHRKDAYNR